MKLLDVTPRESVYEASVDIEYAVALEYLQKLQESGNKWIDAVEIGYLDNDSTGGMNYNAEYILEAFEICKGSYKISCMLHPFKVNCSAWNKEAISKLDFVRVVVGRTYPPMLAEIVDYFKSMGIKTAAHLTNIAKTNMDKLKWHLEDCARLGFDFFYCADSCGSLVPSYAAIISKCIADYGAYEETGVHFHDHLGMALANTLIARDQGMTMADVSIAGLGRGGGNLKMHQAVPMLKEDGLSGEILKELFDITLWYLSRNTINFGKNDAEFTQYINEFKQAVIGMTGLDFSQLGDIEAKASNIYAWLEIALAEAKRDIYYF